MREINASQGDNDRSREGYARRPGALPHNGTQKVFLPMNLRAGIGYSFYVDPENRLTLLMDVNKLLVPSPSEYGQNGEISGGKDVLFPDRLLL